MYAHKTICHLNHHSDSNWLISTSHKAIKSSTLHIVRHWNTEVQAKRADYRDSLGSKICSGILVEENDILLNSVPLVVT